MLNFYTKRRHMGATIFLGLVGFTTPLVLAIALHNAWLLLLSVWFFFGIVQGHLYGDDGKVPKYDLTLCKNL